MTFVHPFDDPLVIAGQGTVGDEILRHRLGDVSAIFVPVGGGGLIAGIGSYVKALRPAVKVIGVEPFGADAMYQSLAAGRRVALDSVGHLRRRRRGPRGRRAHVPDRAERRSTRSCASRTTRSARRSRTSSTTRERSWSRPARSRSPGCARGWNGPAPPGARLAAVLSGANMNFDRLRFVAERAELGDAREALFGVTIPERPGAFRAFCATIGRRVVTEFNYRLSGRDVAHIFVGIATRFARRTPPTIAATLNAGGYATVDLTDNETAKLHVRHMVGGRSAGRRATSSCAGSSFPSGPGALMAFLGKARRPLEHQPVPLPQSRRRLRPRAGRDSKCRMRTMPEFEAFLDGLGYRYQRESGNTAYEMFLG